MSFRVTHSTMQQAMRAARTRPQLTPFGKLRQTPTGLGALQGARWSTGQVSGQPANKDFHEMKESAKEEASQVGHDIQDAISAANQVSTHEGQPSLREQVKSVRDLQATPMPKGAVLFGAAGVVPYFATSATTIYLAHQAALASEQGAGKVDSETAIALLHHVENLQLGYGALILSFIGALHWGFEFAAFNGQKGTPRYLFGLAPVAAAMPTVLLEGELGLAVQFAAFTGAWFLDRTATSWGWTPRWFSAYRFWLTAAVGSSLILTLGGTNYFGPARDVLTTGRKLEALNSQEAANLEAKAVNNPEFSQKVTGKVQGDVGISQSSDSYGLLVNRKKQEEERQKEEEKAKQEAEKKE